MGLAEQKQGQRGGLQKTHAAIANSDRKEKHNYLGVLISLL
jgi:hypothetical protein